MYSIVWIAYTLGCLQMCCLGSDFSPAFSWQDTKYKQIYCFGFRGNNCQPPVHVRWMGELGSNSTCLSKRSIVVTRRWFGEGEGNTINENLELGHTKRSKTPILIHSLKSHVRMLNARWRRAQRNTVILNTQRGLIHNDRTFIPQRKGAEKQKTCLILIKYFLTP